MQDPILRQSVFVNRWQGPYPMSDEYMLDAFPGRLRPTVLTAVQRMPAPGLRTNNGFTARVEGELVKVPHRIYNPVVPDSELAELHQDDYLVVQCLYSRHNNGRIRQANVEKLIATDRSWTAPFVVALIGEYVIEIVQTIRDRLRDMEGEGSAALLRYRQFAVENQDLLALTLQRATSYWNCYYRTSYPNMSDYPAFEALNLFQGPS